MSDTYSRSEATPRRGGCRHTDDTNTNELPNSGHSAARSEFDEAGAASGEMVALSAERLALIHPGLVISFFDTEKLYDAFDDFEQVEHERRLVEAQGHAVYLEQQVRELETKLKADQERF